MQTLTLHIPDSQFPLVLAELEKYKDVKINFNSVENSNNLTEQIKQAVHEVNLAKKGQIKARNARELLDEL